MEKSNTANFGGMNEASLLDAPFEAFMAENSELPLRSVDQMDQPMTHKLNFNDQEFCGRIEKGMDLEITPCCKSPFDNFSDHEPKDDFEVVKPMLEIGGSNYDKILKIKANANIEQKEEDNHTVIDEADEDLKIEDLDLEGPKKQRKDVSYKTILRKCRKFYQQRFNLHTGFLRNKKKEPCSFYRD
jgi:hypothetical protein